jgi:hypothetical protein
MNVMREQSTERAEPVAKGVTSSVRIFVLLFVGLHLVTAIAVWWLMPGGYLVDHLKFWSNRVLPAAVAAYGLTTLALAIRSHWSAIAMMLLLAPITWIGAAVGGFVVFPISGRLPAMAVMIVAVTVLVAIRRHFVEHWPSRWRLAIGVAPWLIGAAVPLTQLAPPPNTRPIAAATSRPTLRVLDTRRPTLRLSETFRVIPGTGTVMGESTGRYIELQPLLTFTSRSPDRCWTNLAPRRLRELPRREPAVNDGFVHMGGLTPEPLWFLDDGYSRLDFIDVNQQRLEMLATSTLPNAVFSHLNTYTEISIAGHKKLSLVFSPAPTTPIDVTYAEYPVGKPRRCAYLGSDGVFRIVEASSGEKGPYHELANGALKPSDRLTITLLDEGTPFARITLADFAAQAGVQPSPTAGWGLPVNAVEFSLSSASERSMASIFVSLASTSVGRGWDSVGHAAGTYRNRVTVEFLP